jgi:hypothetical protein
MERAVEMHASLLMNGNPIRASFSEFSNEKIRIFDHQVAIERDFDRFTKPLHNGWTNGDVRDEVAVHDVDMKHGAAAVNGELRVGAELREVGGQNGWREFDGHARQALPA